MHIRELARLTGTPERQIRYMIAEGFVPPPNGGRAHADYGDDHVTAIRRYTLLRQHGFPPQAIKVLPASGRSVPFPVAPGIVLHVDPQRIGGSLDVEALAHRIHDVLSGVFKEFPDASNERACRKRSR